MESIRAFIFFRILFLLIFLFLLYLSQRFWFFRAWQLIGRIRRPGWRRVLRGAWLAALLAVLVVILDGVTGAHRRVFTRGAPLGPLLGLWLSSAFLAFLAIKLVASVEWLWAQVARGMSKLASHAPHNQLANPSRRYFFQTASYLAGAVPFVGALYGFASERLRYRVERTEVRIANLPPALDGLRIAQLSDIHIGGYMPREQVRRAVEMANDFGAELAVVTGDFITGLTDPLEACVAELARLRAPLGVWGCNGNHEIYADVEAYATELFRRSGVRILRSENSTLVWRGAPLNLIGVDYQPERTPGGRRLPKLVGVERLVRRDIPNILLSHNPNAFPRAAALGIELTLAGHTHGGQVQVEILDRKWNPARFITNYVAGLYQRPCGAPAEPPLEISDESDSAAAARRQSRGTSFLYVNRGLGTIGAPVRINVPPEITLLTLRRV